MAKAKKKKKNSGKSLVLAIIFLIIAIAGCYVYGTYFDEDELPSENPGEISTEVPGGGSTGTSGSGSSGSSSSGSAGTSGGGSSGSSSSGSAGTSGSGSSGSSSSGSTDTSGGGSIEVFGEISFHFMTLGNDKAGDCTYIKAGDNDILIDAGSRSDSIDDIKSYVDAYCTDGKLEYVIVTHGDQDHIAGFAKKNGSIFDLYECGTIIDFPLTSKTTNTYKNYVSERDDAVAAGATHYTALECWKGENGARRVYDLSDDGSIKMEILYNYYYENKTNDENDYSVCVQFSHGDRKFLFTGDLEKDGEEYFVQYNDLSQVELFKAGHHGSKTSSNDCLLDVIKPKICVVCCCAGSVEYTQNLENTFPTQAFIDRIAKYTVKVYVPIMVDLVYEEKYKNADEYELLNGNVVVISDSEQGVYVECSNNDTLLKDTEWFKQNRTTPSYWVS